MQCTECRKPRRYALRLMDRLKDWLQEAWCKEKTRKPRPSIRNMMVTAELLSALGTNVIHLPPYVWSTTKTGA